MAIISVQDYGASGDGKRDDTNAIQQAAATLKPYDTLYFPVGSYRITTQGTLLTVQEISHLKVRFDSEAILLMDNLNEQGRGTGHAFYFRGPADGLTLDGVHIRWRTRPSKRSKGDGIRIDGPASAAGPSEERTVRNILIKDCSVAQAPQTGMVLMGCSDITIQRIKLDNTWADGVHLNACRRFTIDRIVGHNVGDDQVALVTYYSPSTTQLGLGGRNGGPYTQPSLGEWSNYQGKITNVDSTAERRQSANGIRIAGALQVTVEGLRAQRRKAALIIDAGRKGGSFGWEYQASRQVMASDVEADQCHVGLHVMSFRTLPQDELFWNFDVILRNIVVRESAHDNILIEKCSGVQLSEVYSSQGSVRLINLSHLTVNQLRSWQGNVTIHGMSAVSKKWNLPSVPDSHLKLESIAAYWGSLRIENARQIRGDKLTVYYGSGETAMVLSDLTQATFEALATIAPLRFGIRVLRCQRVRVSEATVIGDNKKLVPLEIGGGNRRIRTQEVTFDVLHYQNARRKPKVILQGGPYAPQKVLVNLKYQSEPERKTRQTQYRLK